MAETLVFYAQRGEFIQSQNISRSRWITVSNMSCKPGIVAIYDNVPSGRVPSCTKDQIAVMIFSEDKALILQFQLVQVQHGSSDCELQFAFTTSLCAGKKPGEIAYMYSLYFESTL